MLHQFRNPGNRRRQHYFFVRHSLHQDYRQALTDARERDEIRVAVIAGEVSTGHVTKEQHAILQVQIADEAFERPAFRALACDPAEKIQPLLTQSCAGANQKRIVLHRMQPAHRENAEPLRIRSPWTRAGPWWQIDSQAL